ncbi:SDR family oxidoreductase [Alloacidobacterium sp.]|uniref:SDR family NAD(P)-dependent oxidoreductase n=1 Tax=Alloacidobacterium sp. TaxID=2951999 RepID=UPI002D3BFAB5|nr:SDR family oxidoreductase [Alloacidobacterium sp.]HYK34313.1 SDR family oxidoreductase [Alloacidobacterium sp.]
MDHEDNQTNRRMRLRGKIAIVTGAASGIGRASAITFAREGARVTAVDIDEQHGIKTVEEILADGGEAIFERTDVANEPDVKKMVQGAITRWGKIDILFNNAGIVLAKPLEDTTEEEWDRLISINLKAAFLAIKHVVPHMRRSGGGAILNTGSIGSMVGQVGTPVYSASKGAIALLTKSLALDYGRDGIRVNCLCPGITDTPMLRDHLGHGAQGEARIRDRLSRVPLGAILKPEDVAQAALYLVSDDAIGITGIMHVVDGGLLAAAEFNAPV